MNCPDHGSPIPCGIVGCKRGSVLYLEFERPIPGDGFGEDPIIARGEALERLIRLEQRPSSAAEQNELDSIHLYAKAKQKHLSDFPLAASSIEESVQDLADEEARSAREREHFLAGIMAKAWEQLEPVIDSALAGAVQMALTKR